MLGDDIENKQIFTPMHNKAINLIQILILTKAIWLKKKKKIKSELFSKII